MARPERRLAERNRIEEPRLGTVLRLSRGSIRGIVCGEREDHERGRSSGRGRAGSMDVTGRDGIDLLEFILAGSICDHAAGVSTLVMRYSGLIGLMDWCSWQRGGVGLCGQRASRAAPDAIG